MLLVLGAGLSWLVLPGHMASLVRLVAVCWVVPALGKAFPLAGLAMGICFRHTARGALAMGMEGRRAGDAGR